MASDKGKTTPFFRSKDGFPSHTTQSDIFLVVKAYMLDNVDYLNMVFVKT